MVYGFSANERTRVQVTARCASGSDLSAGGTGRRHSPADTMLGFRPYARATTHRESLPLIGVVPVFRVFHGIVALLAKDGKIDLSN
jgi:hypothetical protein